MISSYHFQVGLPIKNIQSLHLLVHPYQLLATAVLIAVARRGTSTDNIPLPPRFALFYFLLLGCSFRMTTRFYCRFFTFRDMLDGKNCLMCFSFYIKTLLLNPKRSNQIKTR